MSTAFSIQGTLVYPPDDGEPAVPRKFSQSGIFDHKSDDTLVLSGAGTHSVDFGTIPAVKAALIEVDPTAAAPIVLRVNGGTDTVEISPGGFWAYSNPVPAAGITSLDIDYVASARVLVRLLG